MKVLNVNNTIDPVTGGGTAERTFQMSRYLVKSGISCSILTTNIGLTSERIQALNGVEIIAYPCISTRFYVPKFSYKEIKQLIASVDIIHLMGHWTFLNALVYVIARRLKKPYVLCPAGSLVIYGRSKVLKRFYNWIVGKSIIANAQRYIAITEEEIPQFQTYGVNEKKISIIPNGIDGVDYESQDDEGFRKKYGLKDYPFLLFVGRLDYIKGPDLLLRAFCNVRNELKEFHLVYVGPDGGMLRILKEIVEEQDVGDRVHFFGYLGGADKSQAYHAAELLVIPSRKEAMSIVVLESGIAGVPVLLTDKCGFNEIDRVGGGKTVPASVAGLEKGLLEILHAQTQLKSMGSRLKRYTCDHFIWDAIIIRYVKMYNTILAA